MTIRHFYLILFLFIGYHCFPQQNSDNISILFYNVENLFDTYNDSITNDDEFTPDGERHWTYNRMNRKCLNISKVILSASGWNTPAIVSLCEVESRNVLEWLLEKTPLKTSAYKIIHKESPDHRGIDVALLYNSKKFYPLEYEYFPIKNANDSIINTREILYVRGIIDKLDTVHFFVNHWPSRYSGLLETRLLRNKAALLLKQKTEKILDANHSAKIIIMGDFNDQPNDESIAEILKSVETGNSIVDTQLYNLSFDWNKDGFGTMKYQSQWSVFDQFIVSGGLLKDESGYAVKKSDANVLKLPFLLENDEKFGGLKPKRTYIGFKYNDGFSDHLPILLKLNNN